jgi:hypothetical protein
MTIIVVSIDNNFAKRKMVVRSSRVHPSLRTFPPTITIEEDETGAIECAGANKIVSDKMTGNIYADELHARGFASGAI